MNPLQHLKDIRTPVAIEIWPPAYGWWLLAILVVVGICLLTIWLVKARKVTQAKRQALKSLQQIDGSNLQCVSQLNQLLKRVAMTYFPKQNVQKMHGAQWTNFLIKTLPNKKAKNFSESFESMQQKLYQAHTSENTEFPSYCKSVEVWMTHALPPRKGIIHQLEQSDA
jgi:SNF2 family DNA or RNA helicase